MAKPRQGMAMDQLLDRTLATASWLAAALIVAALAWILRDLLHQGLPHLDWRFSPRSPVTVAEPEGSRRS
ncbi:hypothetical protein [Vulcanococcus sp. Clear-D1]|jgi:hypothetical protein|uniref:hypothetical protein n=1 Tax=Vulcanococcus sp. Clear-D1 TaxID=2766970 RepID=UPI0025DCEB83|nr:hypothetical protein [Vulcanococcus sp. Clear-D1]